MALYGDIALRARGEIPETWDKLSRATIYGEMQLQMRVDFVKYQLFGTVCDPSLEATTYNPVQLMLAGKKVALSVIPSGADFWSNQMITEVNTGTQETRTFPDRIASLWRIHARLLSEVATLEGSVTGVVPVSRRMAQPQIDTTGPYRTADPNTWEPSASCATTFQYSVTTGIHIL